MKKWWIFAVLAHAAAFGQPAVPKPDSFAYQSRIDLAGSAPFHQLVLPLAVYQGVRQADLADLRVFNGQGEVVPHALIRSEPVTTSQVTETPLPLFPIIAPSGKREGTADLLVQVRRNADGTLISVREPQASAAAQGVVVQGALLDASHAAAGVRSLKLEVGPTATPFHPLTVETSDDLQHWRLLKGDAQLVRLEHEGRRVEKNTVEWEADAGKYIRVLWRTPEQAPAITSAMASATRVATAAPAMTWTEPMAPVRTQNDSYEYTWQGRLPLEQLRIGLAQPNTLAPIRIQYFVPAASRRDRDSWETLAQTVAYRLQSPQGDVRSPDIPLNRPALDSLRLAVDGRIGGIGGAPTLQIGFVPDVLVFLARGEGPFKLAWGAAGVQNAALPASTLIPGYRGDTKLDALTARLQPVAIDAAPRAPAADARTVGPASKQVLWIVLIAGVLLLAGMTWALVKQMKSVRSGD